MDLNEWFKHLKGVFMPLHILGKWCYNLLKKVADD